MIKRSIIGILLILLAATVLSCKYESDQNVNAADYGVLPANSPEDNSKNLQALIDLLAASGGTVYIPAGEYLFAQNGTQTIGSHCIKMRSNVSVVGAGDETVLMPVGDSQYGMDMFYFNDYLDIGEANYLENCRFEHFVIDASNTSCKTYTSAGKGFMFNLFRNCHWNGVTVRYTDATGFGVDCPINSTMTRCTAIGCGKAATTEDGGASGFGIGFGYCDHESISIKDCYALDNRKFGFFFEHQGRFDSGKYTARSASGFLVNQCTAQGNLFNFGGIDAFCGTYVRCLSKEALDCGFYFQDCTEFELHGCTLLQSGIDDIRMIGAPGKFVLTENQADRNRVRLGELSVGSINSGNSWN